MITTTDKVEVAVYQTSKKGNASCGDGYFFEEIDNKFVCALADGLGSGEPAKESADAVLKVVRENYLISDKELAKLCTKSLVGLRGVVLGILILDYDTEDFRFLSIGNIGLRTISMNKKKSRNIPNQGYLGGFQRDFKVMKSKLEPETKFVLFTDGVTDSELSVDYFLYSNVEKIISTFESLIDAPREDDTTLIAINYKG